MCQSDPARCSYFCSTQSCLWGNRKSWFSCLFCYIFPTNRGFSADQALTLDIMSRVWLVPVFASWETVKPRPTIVTPLSPASLDHLQVVGNAAAEQTRFSTLLLICIPHVFLIRLRMQFKVLVMTNGALHLPILEIYCSPVSPQGVWGPQNRDCWLFLDLGL